MFVPARPIVVAFPYIVERCVPVISVVNCCTGGELRAGRILVPSFLQPITSFMFVNVCQSPAQKIKVRQPSMLKGNLRDRLGIFLLLFGFKLDCGCLVIKS